jgi:hypothetical protein
MIKNKKILTIAGLLIFILVTVGIVLVSTNSKEQEQQEESNPFTISGLDDPKYLFSSDKQAAVVSGIDYYLKADDIDTNNMRGVVRKDSFSQKEVYGSTVITILVDIADAKRTYKVSSSGSGSPDGDNSLYVLCPSQEELIYGSFNCKDDTNE